MGYFLLYESMLDTVLVARDKFLVRGWWLRCMHDGLRAPTLLASKAALGAIASSALLRRQS